MEKRMYGSTDMNLSVLGFGGSEIGGLGGPDAHSKSCSSEHVERLLSNAWTKGST